MFGLLCSCTKMALNSSAFSFSLPVLPVLFLLLYARTEQPTSHCLVIRVFWCALSWEETQSNLLALCLRYAHTGSRYLFEGAPVSRGHQVQGPGFETSILIAFLLHLWMWFSSSNGRCQRDDLHKVRYVCGRGQIKKPPLNLLGDLKELFVLHLKPYTGSLYLRHVSSLK